MELLEDAPLVGAICEDTEGTGAEGTWAEGATSSMTFLVTGAA